MIDLGLLEKSDYGIQLGSKLFELGSLARGPRSIRELAQPALVQLRNLTKHTVQLAVLDGDEVIYMDIQPGIRGLPHLPSRLGGRLPAHATAVGKSMLAYTARPPSDSGDRLPSLTRYTLGTEGRLNDQLERVRELGLAVDHQESALGVCCVASPIIDSAGLPIAALSVSTDLASFDVSGLGNAVRSAAGNVTRRLMRVAV